MKPTNGRACLAASLNFDMSLYCLWRIYCFLLALKSSKVEGCYFGTQIAKSILNAQNCQSFIVFYYLLNYENTVGKFQDFSVIQILREISFGESRSSETAVLTMFSALNFVHLVIFSLQKVQNLIEITASK